MTITYANPAPQDLKLEWYRSNTTHLLLLPASVNTYAAAVSAAIGNHTVVPSAITDGAGGAREFTIPAFTGGTVTADGSAQYVAFTNGTDTLAFVKEATAVAAFIAAGNWEITADYTITDTAIQSP